MRKLFLLTALVAAMTISAKDIWTGNQLVEWGDGILINADEFTSAEVGQKIVLHYTGASDGVEFKVRTDGTPMLPGSLKNAWISGDGTYELFLTHAAVADLSDYGLQIVGAHFTATKVELLDGKNALKEGTTVWTGYYWVDGWGSLTLYNEAYKNINFNEVDAIRYYSEASGSGYVLKLIKTWEPAEETIATKADMTEGEGYVQLRLTDELRTALKEVGHWEIQMEKGTESAFNFTDIVLVPKSGPATAISNTEAPLKASKRLVNGQVVIIRDNKTYNVLGAEL